MSKNFNTNTKNNDEWLTPKHITDSFSFDLDPCSPIVRPWDTAKKHFNINDDGLKMPWDGFVFCNPPYGKETYIWLKRCAEHNNCLALTFARTETKGFQEQVFEKATSVFFFKGRLSFHYVDGTKGDAANAPSVLIAYGKQADCELKKFAGSHAGKYIPL